jgi:hypothetical protein
MAALVKPVSNRKKMKTLVLTGDGCPTLGISSAKETMNIV